MLIRIVSHPYWGIYDDLYRENREEKVRDCYLKNAFIRQSLSVLSISVGIVLLGIKTAIGT